MKKIMFLTLFAAGLLTTACDKGDYDDWAQPQSNEQKDAITVPGFTATAAGAVDLNTAGDSVKVISLSQAELPAGSTLGNIRMTVAPEGGDNEPVLLNAITTDGLFAKSQLQETVVGFFGPRPDARTLTAQVYANVITGGQAAYVDCGEVTLTITPKAPHISSKYYLVGGPLDWAASAASKEQVFTHSNKDVYDDPVFTYVMESTGGEMWFAFGDDEACDAISGANDWSKLFGTKGESKDLTGSFDYRYNLGGDHSFCVDGGASSYRISINMMDMTYEITPVTIAAQYYVVGAIQGWSDSKRTHMFTPEGKNVLSYTTKWTAAWDLKIWEKASFGNWDVAWGCAVDGDNSPSGALINSGAQAISAPSAEYYTFTIDMNSQTYTWTKLGNQSPTEYSNISLIGEFNGWGGDYELEQVAPHNWYCVFTQEEDGQLKYRANHDWSTNWGFGNDKDWDVTEGFNRIGTNGGGNIWVPAGTYEVYLNDITSSMMIVAK